MNDLSLGVPDIEKLSRGAWSYEAVNRTHHLVRHAQLGLAFWVQSELLTDEQVDAVMDMLDETLLTTLVNAQQARIQERQAEREQEADMTGYEKREVGAEN